MRGADVTIEYAEMPPPGQMDLADRLGREPIHRSHGATASEWARPGIAVPLLPKCETPCTRSTNPDDWHTTSSSFLRQRAERWCRPCPVRAECLAYALKWNVLGVWGGTSEGARHSIRRANDLGEPMRVVADPDREHPDAPWPDEDYRDVAMAYLIRTSTWI